MKQDIQINHFQECHGRHVHEYPQVLIPLKASLRLVAGETECQVSSRELCFIPEGMEHTCDFKGEMLALNLDGQEITRHRYFLAEPFVLSMKGQILQLIQLIQAELREQPESESVKHLYRYFYSKLMEECMPPSIWYISNHYDAHITMEQLACIENYNVKYYNDWFKQKTGVSPGYYLRRTRIDKAKEILEKTEFGMTEIAVMIGYSSNSSFTRAFRSITGVSPETYRKTIFNRGERMTKAL